jgi:hypothetical protein
MKHTAAPRCANVPSAGASPSRAIDYDRRCSSQKKPRTSRVVVPADTRRVFTAAVPLLMSTGNSKPLLPIR